MPNPHQTRYDHAQLLLGRMVRFAHQADYQAHRVKSISLDGLVEIEGFSGLFSPYLFVVVESTPATKDGQQ